MDLLLYYVDGYRYSQLQPIAALFLGSSDFILEITRPLSASFSSLPPPDSVYV